MGSDCSILDGCNDITGLTLGGVDVHTRGKMKKEAVEVFYVPISSKKSTDI